MRQLIKDPVSWATSAVGSWPRLLISFLLLSLIIAYAAYDAAENGWRSSAGIVGFLCWMQLLLLYSMKQLLLRVKGDGEAEDH